MKSKIILKEYINPLNSERKVLKIIWYFINILVLKNSFIVSTRFKVFILKIFGARIGDNVVIKPRVNIKYPWNLKIGNNTWIGENVWIDNLDMVTIGDNVCLSQGSMILCGNHNYKKKSFDLILKPIIIEDGAWLCAKALLCPGSIMKSHSILTAGSVGVKIMEEYCVYKGNPAIKVSKRKIM